MNIDTFNTLRPRQKGRHFPDDIFKWIFLNENVWISITISLKFVPKGPINNIPALVQIMAWRRPGDKPLSEPMMVRFPTHICVTRPQWVKVFGEFGELHFRHRYNDWLSGGLFLQRTFHYLAWIGKREFLFVSYNINRINITWRTIDTQRSRYDATIFAKCFQKTPFSYSSTAPRYKASFLKVWFLFYIGSCEYISI